MGYRALAVDLLTGTQLDELPFDRLKFDHQPLNGHGTVEIDVSLHDARSAWLRPVRTLVVVERDDEVVAHGIVWRRTPESGTWKAHGAGLTSIFDHLRIRQTRTYAGVNADTIVADLIAYAQAAGDPVYSSSGTDVGRGSALGMVHTVAAPSAGAGLSRDRTYPGHERKPVSTAIAQLGGVLEGFDWRPEIVRLPDGSLERRLTTAHPRFGSTLVDVALVLGATVTGYAAPEDGSAMTTLADVAGAGEEDGMLFGTYAPGAPAGYPELEGVWSYRDVTEQATLDERAQLLQERRAGSVVLPRLTLRRRFPGWDPVTSFDVGDTLPVLIEEGSLHLEGDYRCTSRSVTVDAQQAEVVTVDLSAPILEEIPA